MTRKFTTLDAMVLVAATAAGLGLTRSLTDTVMIQRHVTVWLDDGKGATTGEQWDSWSFKTSRNVYPSLPWWNNTLISWSIRLAYWPGPMLASWSLATFGLGLRQGRGRRTARRPGAAAGLAVLLALAASATLWSVFWTGYSGPGIDQRMRLTHWWPNYWSTLPKTAGFGVVVAWSVLAWGGRWTPSPGWHDRLGRVLGMGWIAMAAAGISSELLLILPRLG